MNKIIQLSRNEINRLIEIIKPNKEAFRALILLLSNFWKPSRVMKILENKRRALS